MVDRKKFEDVGCRITVLGRSVYVTDAMKKYAEDKLGKLERFATHLMHIEVTLDVQRLEHGCSILVKLEHFTIRVSAASSDMYASIDEAVKRLEQKIRRWKGMIQDHLGKHLAEVDMVVNVVHHPTNDVEEINAEIEQENDRRRQKTLALPKVVGTETHRMKVLTLAEAVMKLELSNDDFLVYRSEEDRKLKIIYRRDDGNFGILQPE